MAKVKKSTKKFLQNKGNARTPDKFGRKTKSQARGIEKNGLDNQDGDEQMLNMTKVAEMDIDEFLQGDFLLDTETSLGVDLEDSLDDGDEPSPGTRGEGEDSEGDSGLLLEGDDDDDDDENDDEVLNALARTDEGKETMEDDSDEEDDVSEDLKNVRQQNRRLKDEIDSHRMQLEKLKESDPEFYQYLEATDRELLAFGKDDESDEEEEEEDMEKEHEEEYEEKKVDGDETEEYLDDHDQGQQEAIVLTLDLVESWCTIAKKTASPGLLRNLLRAYRVACHHGDTEDSANTTMKLASSAVYNKLMLFVLQEADSLLRRAIGIDGDPEPSVILRSPRWRKMENLVKSYLGNTLHLLGQMTEPGMVAYIVRRMRPSVPFLAPFKKLQRRYLKLVLQLFGSADAAPRVQAILLIRSMALRLPSPAIDMCLKGVYKTYVSNAKFVNASSVPHINFMAACVVELYSIDGAVAYRLAFGFVRQLALLMRQALTAKSKDAYRQVYCWQTINCLELWAKVVAASPEKSAKDDLKPLIYPVAQLLLGAARLVPTPSYFPLRLRCVRALNQLAKLTGVYIPVSSILLEVLQWSDLSKPPKPTPGEKAPEILLQLKLGKIAARSKLVQEEVVEQVFELLADHLAQWSFHVAFPELAQLPLTILKRFIKSSTVDRFRRGAKQLANAIERNIEMIGKARDRVDFAPKDLQAAKAFLLKESTTQGSPVAQHAITLLERARQRMATRSTESVRVGTELPGSNQLQLSEQAESDDDEDTPKQIPMPKKKDKSGVGKAGDNSLNLGSNKRSNKRSADEAGLGKRYMLDQGQEGNEDDELTEYQLSDLDDDDDGDGEKTENVDDSDEGETRQNIKPASRRKPAQVQGKRRKKRSVAK